MGKAYPWASPDVVRRMTLPVVALYFRAAGEKIAMAAGKAVIEQEF